MLQPSGLLAEIDLEGDEYPTFTDWARALHVPDIWREVLKVSGENYRQLTKEVWKEPRHLYRSERRRVLEMDGGGNEYIWGQDTEDDSDISDTDSDDNSGSYDDSDSQGDSSIVDIDGNETNRKEQAGGGNPSSEQDEVMDTAEPNDDTVLSIFFSHPASSLLL